MAAEFKIGRLRYTWSGTWTANTPYNRDDIVLNDGKIWLCLIPNTSSASFYTDLYATFPVWSQITDGKTWTGPWTPNTVYGLGDIAIFGGKAYYCTTAHSSQTLFETDASKWSEHTEFAGWHTGWLPNTEYGVNDVVKYGGIVYKCITNHVSAGSSSQGLEANQSAWTVYYQGIEYKGAWQSSFRYKLNDLVKVNANIYICTQYHTSSSLFSTTNFTVWLPGQMFELTWANNVTYQLGDAVIYGGDAYVSITANNLANVPSTSSANWTLFNVGYSIRGDWSTAPTIYAVGDVVRRNGMLYEAIQDNTSSDPSNYSTTANYISTGSSGTTVKISSSTGIVPGMIVSGTGITLSQTVSTVSTTTASSTSSTIKGTPITISSFASSTAVGPFTVTFAIPSQAVAPTTSVNYLVAGNSNTNFNGSFNCTASTTTSITLSYPNDPGSYGSGTTTVSALGTSITLSSFTSTVATAYNVIFNIPTQTVAPAAGSPYILQGNSNSNYNGVYTCVASDPPGSLTTITLRYLTNPGSYGSGTTTVTGSGTALTIGGTVTGTFAVGMTISGLGIGAGTTIVSGSSPNWVISQPQIAYNIAITGTGYLITLNQQPDGTLTNNEILTFTGVNSQYWELLVPGRLWLNRWTTGTNYLIGDTVVWNPNTYTCVKDHTSANTVTVDNVTTVGNRPDLDTTSIYWSIEVAGTQVNAMNNLGDLETFTTGPGYTAIPIGAQQYTLQNSSGIPTWKKINTVPNVYYVDSDQGTDRADYGTTWDQPFKTINYSCNLISQGIYYKNAGYLLQINKGWMITEMYQWMLYQMSQSNSPFSPDSLWDPFYTQRDAGYIIDSVIYDMARGGNSQTVAATLRFFYYGSQTQFVNSLTASVVSYLSPALTQLASLMISAISQVAPAQSYQQLNNVPITEQINQYITPFVGQTTVHEIQPEVNYDVQVSSLMSIITTALTNQNTYLVPASNSGITSVLYVKTGTYNEQLPIVVPENTSIVGDELRSTTIQPATSITTYCTQTIASTNSIVVLDASRLADNMPLQFVSPYVNTASTTFGNVVSGQTYYVIGDSIDLETNSFQLNDNPTFEFTGTATLGSPIISNASRITNLAVGMVISGPGIPTGTTVLSFTQAITSIATITLSANATISGILKTFTATGNVVSVVDGTGNMLVYAGDCLKNMWLLRNGTTMRNMSLFGLKGTLTNINQYATARPTGGAYTSLDPGTGPDDTTAWIFRRSPYIQNVTTFGDGCVGTKIDGTLHNGGFKSMVHNDYTQVISDGIGAWVTGSGAVSELVSVFSYYCYIGHFAEAGGRIRSTNGNSSYGIFGVLAEGYDINEVPSTGNIYNQSLQVQATVQDSFGTNQQLLKLNYSNAGSAYYLPTTNMLAYSNNFAVTWTNDANITFIKNNTAPTSYTEAWLLTGSKSTPGTGYVQQSVSINPAGYSYSGLTGTTQGGAPGNGAKFNIIVTPTTYVVTVDPSFPGTQYQVGNTILIKGSVLGGLDSTNDLTITVATLTGSGILSVGTPVGTVPAGSSQSYTLSIYVYAGTSPTVDIQATFSGSTTVTSGISYNVGSNVVTPYSGQSLIDTSNGGTLPTSYGAIKTLVSGWYRVWMSINDLAGINNTLTFKFFPQGANAPIANTYSVFYGAQIELSGTSPSPDFYLETASSMYTAYANYEIVGAGAGAVMSGDEIRSQSVFNARVTTDSNNITGGSGYATSSNNAQTGDTTSIQLSNADPGLYNYIGMRVFINSGTGAGQYGFISYYNKTSTTDTNGIASKTALILQESVDPIPIVQSTYSATAANNVLTITSGTDLSYLYKNQAIQFIPTYYNSVITSSSIATKTVTATQGGTVNTITVDTTGLADNMPVQFSGSGFNLTPGYVYYIVNIIDANTLQISNVQFGDVIQLSTVLLSAGVTMTMSYPNYSGYLTGSTTNMVPNIPIQFTGYAIGGVTLGSTYYIQDIIDASNFTVSTSQISLTTTTTTGGATSTITATTTSLIPLNPVVFGGTIFDSGISAGTTYYINSIVDSTSFSISSTINRFTVTRTAYSTNLITLNSVANFVAGQPIIFSGINAGSTFGNITPEFVYYIQTINGSTNQITISTDKINTFVLTDSVGTIFARTCLSTGAVALGGGSGSMTITSTGVKFVATNSIGALSTMSATFSTSLFGGINSYTKYYISSITPGQNPTISISSTVNGTPITLQNGVGNMRLGACGWDNINPTIPNLVLDSTSVYFVEPRALFSEPPNSQTTGSVTTPLAGGSTWQAIAYGNNNFIAIPTNGVTGGSSTDGLNWSSITLPGNSGYTWTSIAFGNFYWVTLGTTQSPASASIAAYSNSNGQGWRTVSMPSNATWSSIAYGNGTFVAIATGTNKAAYSTNFGASWSASSALPASKTWVGLSYGTGIFVAVASDGTGAWSTNGITWQSSTLPQNTTTLSGVTITGGAGTFSCTASVSQLVVGQQITISGTAPAGGAEGSITGYTNPTTYTISATNGKDTFTLSGVNGAITTSAGTPTTLTYSVGTPAYTGIIWGNGRFMAVQNGIGLKAAYSFDGVTWYQSLTYISGTSVVYGQGAFLVVSNSGTTAYKSDSGIYWRTRTLSYGSINTVGFGYTSANIGIFPTLAGTGGSLGNATGISEGVRAQAHAAVTSGVITQTSLWETGSGYSSTPTLAFVDYNVSVSAVVTPRIGNGVLGNPTFVNRGTGYNTTSTQITITGNGYADAYQTGYTLIMNNLSALPITGSNLTIAGNSQVYKVTSAVPVYGTQPPFLQANVQVSPTMTTALSPANGAAVSFRQLYSQVRLTGHDFLSVGTGNKTETNYPNWDETQSKIQNQAVETNQGHVFYTATDENGNFNVGGLFGVQQSTGTVTLSATQFGLQGLNTLSLGGIAVGSASVVITQFSTDSTFVANSDAIIPTQRAIKSYLTGRLSQGGANTYTGQFTAGTVVVGGPNLIKSTIPNGTLGSNVKMKNKVYISGKGGVSGDMAALNFFIKNSNHRS